MKNIEYIGGGIRCDNPNCDYVNDSVKIEDYKDWVNKPCPKCGANLLTEEDFYNVNLLFSVVDLCNEIPPDLLDINSHPDEKKMSFKIDVHNGFKVSEDNKNESTIL